MSLQQTCSYDRRYIVYYQGETIEMGEADVVLFIFYRWVLRCIFFFCNTALIVKHGAQYILKSVFFYHGALYRLLLNSAVYLINFAMKNGTGCLQLFLF